MIDTERTLCIFKPDLAANLHNTTQALMRVLELKLVPVELRRLTMTVQHATVLYDEHVGQPHFWPNVEFVTSAPSYLMVLEGESACARLRELLGATDPAKARPGTLRALYGSKLPRNAAHGSATPADAEREIALFFLQELQ